VYIVCVYVVSGVCICVCCVCMLYVVWMYVVSDMCILYVFEGLSPKAFLAASVMGPAPCIINSYRLLAVANSLIVSTRDFMMK